MSAVSQNLGWPLAPGKASELLVGGRKEGRKQEEKCVLSTYYMSLTTEFISTCPAAGILSVPFISMESGSLNILVILVKVTRPEYPSHCLLTSHSSLAQDWPFTFQESYMFLNMTS